MAPGWQITCANKNLNGTIVRIGGDGWSLSRHEAIQKLIGKQISLYIHIGNETYNVGTRGTGTDTYLVLEPDAIPLKEVDGLISC